MLIIFVFTILCVTVYGAGELSILQSPESLQFRGQEPVDLSVIKNIFSLGIGFTVAQSSHWPGLVIRDPFNFAEGLVVVSVPGVSSLDSVQGRTYPLNTDESLDNTFHSLSYRMADRFPTVDNLTVNYVNVDDPSTIVECYGPLFERDSPDVEYLRSSSSVDKSFIDQIDALDALTSKIAETGISMDGLPDLHWINIPGLHSLVDTYGSGSKQVQEAKRLLSSSILLLSEVFTNAYDDRVLFAVVSSDVIHTRRYRRQVLLNDQKGDDVDDEFAAMFNIFLWFSLTFFFVLLACSVGIAKMDPGRDSIIYRMTSNRMKKEN